MNIYKKWLIKLGISVFVLALIFSVLGKSFLISPVFNINNFKLSKSIDTLIIGASHSACSFDPVYFQNTLNLSKNGEPLFFTYYKIKALLKNNTQIKTLIIAYSAIHISRSQDFNLFYGNPASRENILNYFLFLDDSGRKYFNRLSPDYLLASAKYDYGLPLSYTNDLKIIFQYYMKKINYSSYPFWGGYTGLAGNHLDNKTTNEIVQRHFIKDNKSVGFSKVAIEYIKKLANLGRNKSIDIILVNTPIHKSLRERIPNSYTNKYKEIVSGIIKMHPNTKYQNFSDLKLPDIYYLDGDHLNIKGGKYFSKLYSKKINTQM